MGAGTCDKDNKNMWACCSPKNRCGEMQGDCDADADCLDDFVCTRNSCPDSFKDAGFPQGQADCCTSKASAQALRLASFNFLAFATDKSEWTEETYQNYGEPGSDPITVDIKYKSLSTDKSDLTEDFKNFGEPGFNTPE